MARTTLPPPVREKAESSHLRHAGWHRRLYSRGLGDPCRIGTLQFLGYPDFADSARGQPDVDRDHLLAWTTRLLDRLEITPAVVFDPPDRRLFQIHRRLGDREVFFLANLDGERTLAFNARFDTGDKTPWLWDPRTGDRSVFPHGARPNRLTLRLEPFESMLLVFEPDMPGTARPAPEDHLHTSRDDQTMISGELPLKGKT